MASSVQSAQERLSVTTAIIGLLAVGGKIIDALWDVNPPPRHAKAVFAQALQEIKQCRSTVHILYKTFALVELAQLPFPERGTWIKADYLIATLTDTVLAVSDLQRICALLNSDQRGPATPPPEDTGVGDDLLPSDKTVSGLCSRIRWHNLSMTMMMTILKCPGESDAQNSKVGLERRMTRLLSANTQLADRMRRLDGFCGRPESGSLSHYGGNDPGSPDNRALSPFSRCNLSDVPVLSVIALPVTTDELVDGSEFYTFAYAQRVSRDLSELMRNQSGQGTSRSLGVILGWSNTGVVNGGSASSTGSSNDSSPVVVEPEPDTRIKTKKWRVRSFKVRRRWRA